MLAVVNVDVICTHLDLVIRWKLGWLERQGTAAMRAMHAERWTSSPLASSLALRIPRGIRSGTTAPLGKRLLRWLGMDRLPPLRATGSLAEKHAPSRTLVVGCGGQSLVCVGGSASRFLGWSDRESWSPGRRKRETPHVENTTGSKQGKRFSLPLWCCGGEGG